MMAYDTVSIALLVGILILIGFLLYKIISYKIWYASDNDPIINRVRINLIRIDPKFGKIPIKISTKSYTQHKRIVYLCIKDPRTGDYYDMNTIMYVALHEVAHVMSASYSSDEDHNDEWRNNFNELLRRATLYGFYNPAIKMPSNYCGINNS